MLSGAEREHIGIGDVVVGNQQALRGNHASSPHEVHGHDRPAQGRLVHIVDILALQLKPGSLHLAHKAVRERINHPHTLVRPRKEGQANQKRYGE